MGLVVIMTGFRRFFDISGRRSEPEVDNVMFDVQFNDYLNVQ